MRNQLISLSILFTFSCGTDTKDRPQQRTETSEKSQAVVQSDPQTSGAVVIPVVGVEAVPTSYTFLDTPNANLCADAFIRQGIDLPVNIVARTIRIRNVRQGGISLQDMGSSTTPVLNIVTLENRCSDTTFQFMNPIGFYCIVRNDAEFANVTIQRRCSAQMAELEPMTHNSVQSAPDYKSCGMFGFLCWGKGLEGTQTSYNSSIIETPCIP